MEAGIRAEIRSTSTIDNAHQIKYQRSQHDQIKFQIKEQHDARNFQRKLEVRQMEELARFKMEQRR
jgi:hypothetical protein